METSFSQTYPSHLSMLFDDSTQCVRDHNPCKCVTLSGSAILSVPAFDWLSSLLSIPALFLLAVPCIYT